MPKKYIFSDEAGCFAFNRGPNVSKYFIVTTVVMDDCSIGAELLDLRRELSREGLPVEDHFHASADKQIVRDRVFELIADRDFRVDATIIEKAKAQPHIRPDEPTFFRYAWFYHFKHLSKRLFLEDHDELSIIAASLGTKKQRVAFKGAVNNVAQQVIERSGWHVEFPASKTEPCLQVADYFCWAIQRKWERDCKLSYALIEDRVHSEFDLFRTGTDLYY